MWDWRGGRGNAVVDPDISLGRPATPKHRRQRLWITKVSEYNATVSRETQPWPLVPYFSGFHYPLWIQYNELVADGCCRLRAASFTVVSAGAQRWDAGPSGGGTKGIAVPFGEVSCSPVETGCWSQWRWDQRHWCPLWGHFSWVYIWGASWISWVFSLLWAVCPFFA